MSASTLRSRGGWAAALLALAGVAAADPTPASAPASAPVVRMAAIEQKPLNRGTLYYALLEDKGQGQNFAVWIPDGLKEVKGLIFVMHRGSEAYRTELQEVARSLDFAVVATLIRWTGYEQILPYLLERFGQASGHPELVNCPIAGVGFSRNVGAWLRYNQLRPELMLCHLAGGGPGTGVDVNKPDQVAFFKPIPIMQVNGSEDPFVDQGNGKLAWQTTQYPKVRAAGLPFSTGLEWGLGHSSDNHITLYLPFLKAVYAARVPAGASPAKGPVSLKPYPSVETTGVYVDPGDWQGKSWGTAIIPAAQFKGDVTKMVWLPDEDTAATWRAFVSRDTAATVQVAARSDPAAPTALELKDAPAGVTQVEYFSAARSLGRATAAPFQVSSDVLNTGAHPVYAVLTVEGKGQYTQPILVAGGEQVSQKDGMRRAGESDLPINVIRLSDAQRATLSALAARRASAAPGGWKLVFEDTFDQGLKPAWYEYYGPNNKKSDSKIEAVDGAMKVSGSKQAIAMLPYDWPEDLAIEYRAKALSDAPCDLSVVLAGNASGTAFAWREGLMFQFGAAYNAKSQFLLLEQPKSVREDVKIKPQTWHTVRIERRGGRCTATIDGQPVAELPLTREDFDRFWAPRVGLYVFGSAGLFDDVRIYAWEPADPSAVQPAMPSEAALDDLARALVGQMNFEFAEVRDSANRLVRDYAWELGPALQRLLDAEQVTDPKARERLAALLTARRPG